MKALERVRRIWKAEKAKEAAAAAVPSERFLALVRRATGPAAWVLADKDTVLLMWLHADNEAAIQAATLANFRPAGVIAWVGGRIETEIEPGREAAMAKAYGDFVLACAALQGLAPSAAA